MSGNNRDDETNKPRTGGVKRMRTPEEQKAAEEALRQRDKDYKEVDEKANPGTPRSKL